ncbi:MAG: cbb3-type cytochrome c oxidase subunit I, partial [Pseudomonadota bacterium]|nr:cbb3-type cytochrome c oxidase subunit I [Pseudomonadota bacterium]
NMYDERLGKIHFWTAVIAVNMTFFPMHFVGLAGMPRRIVDYSIAFADFNLVSSIGAALLGVTQVLFLYIVIKAIRGGEKATSQVWEGAEGLEWTIPSPAPLHTFETPPQFPTPEEAYKHE